jgi:hypothetical protein
MGNELKELLQHIKYVQALDKGERDLSRLPLMKVAADMGEKLRKAIADGTELPPPKSPFKYILSSGGAPSPYLTYAVYSYLREAIEKGVNRVRFGPANVRIDEGGQDSLDDFSDVGEAMIPYVLETIRYDTVLARYVGVVKEGDILLISIKSTG